MGDALMKKSIFGVPKNRFWIYFAFFVFGIAMSILFVFLDYRYNDSTISFFVSFFASVIVTCVFTYLVDYLNCTESNRRNEIRKKTIFDPIQREISGIFHRTIIAVNNYEQKNNYTFDDFEECLVKSFDYYSIEINNYLKNPNDLKAINNACNIKNGIEVYSGKELIKSIDKLLNMKDYLLEEELLKEWDFYIFSMLKDSAEKIYYPYFNVTMVDKNTAQGNGDYPKAPINSIVTNNFKGNAKMFVSLLRDISKQIKIFNNIEKLAFPFEKKDGEENGRVRE